MMIESKNNQTRIECLQRAMLRTFWNGFVVHVIPWENLAVRKMMWRRFRQNGEFNFHKNQAWRPKEDFLTEVSGILEHLGYGRNQFGGQIVLDVGAGSQLLTRFFEGAYIIAIEPLADKFLTELDWCELKDADEVYSVPAEQRLRNLVEQVDFVVCINVLDNCFDPPSVLKNIHEYLRSGGKACISVDCHLDRDPMHPHIMSEISLVQMSHDTGFTVEKVMNGLGDVYPEDKLGFGSSDTVTLFLSKQ